MAKDIYGAVNRHYGSEPDTERDEEAVTEWAEDELHWDGFCRTCRAGLMPEASDAEFYAWVTAHAATCTPLRERVVAERD